MCSRTSAARRAVCEHAWGKRFYSEFMGVVRRIYNSFRLQEDRYFHTPNPHLAAVLFSRGFKLVNVNRTDPANCQFVSRKQRAERVVFVITAAEERLARALDPPPVRAASYIFRNPAPSHPCTLRPVCVRWINGHET